tara:strand:- start:679 stop:957 length:279 start_codon:yes stop_codon:yes gene_type:complete
MRTFFENGWGVSVIHVGKSNYLSKINTDKSHEYKNEDKYELAVLKGTNEKFEVDNDNSVTLNDVLVTNTKGIDEAIKLVSKFPKAFNRRKDD